MRALVVTLGMLLAAAIAFGRAFFGILGANTIWYAIGIALPYLLVSFWLAARLGITARAGRPTTGAVWLLTVLSWICAFAFAITVPDIQADGSLAAITALPGADPVALEMVIALCNPFAILQFVFLGGAIAVSWHNSHPPRPEPEDDELRMVSLP